ncbi:hypothetical protein GUJ93_ZPchr0010g7867 [Zizania palustris]|uniref:Uncharacterized protein n=1 Tax=Zizania palustris TaxID=103762 RepID=A0A8J5W7A1_ZIZPA|nr:hypothetical protein GUJ93_ZPchr0010g7867 [Zizania palustris]
MPIVEPLPDDASPYAPPPAIPILPPDTTLTALVPTIPAPSPSLTVPTQHPALSSPTLPAHTTVASTSGPSMVDASDLRPILPIPPAVRSVATSMPEYVIIDDDEDDPDDHSSIRYDDIMVDDDAEEDNDDHSNINYDDIIVDDEQDGAGMDDHQDEDPKEIEPMIDDEE